MIVTTATILCYVLYSFNSPHSIYMMWTIPFAIYGIFRYMHLTEAKGLGDQLVAVLAKDLPLLVTLALWGLSVVGILVYFNNG